MMFVSQSDSTSDDVDIIKRRVKLDVLCNSFHLRLHDLAGLIKILVIS